MPAARARRSTCNACTRPATVFMADFTSKIHRRLCERDAESTPLLEIPGIDDHPDCRHVRGGTVMSAGILIAGRDCLASSSADDTPSTSWW